MIGFELLEEFILFAAVKSELTDMCLVKFDLDWLSACRSPNYSCVLADLNVFVCEMTHSCDRWAHDGHVGCAICGPGGP